MPKKQTYSIQQLAKETNIPASSVRYYRNEYKEYFPHTRLEGSKYPVYEAECIKVLQTIRKSLDGGGSKHDVIEELDKKFTPIYENEVDDSTNQQTNKQQVSNNDVATTETQGLSVMQTVNQMRVFNENQLQITEHYKQQAIQQREIIEELQEKIKELEQPGSQDKNKNKKGFLWWKE